VPQPENKVNPIPMTTANKTFLFISFPLFLIAAVWNELGTFKIANHLSRSSPLKEPKHHHNDCNDQQDMNKITKRITAHQPQQPQDYQYDGDRPQHGSLLSDCAFPQPAIA